MTITEGLARIKTIMKRVEKKEEFVILHIGRASTLTDPLAAVEGGSVGSIKREMQAIGDLRAEILKIRKAINKANRDTPVSVNGATKTIEEWLIWKREVAPGMTLLMNRISEQIRAGRAYVDRHNRSSENKTEWISHFPEKDLAELVELHESILSDLDGQLSLKNATVQIDIEP